MTNNLKDTKIIILLNFELINNGVPAAIVGNPPGLSAGTVAQKQGVNVSTSSGGVNNPYAQNVNQNMNNNMMPTTTNTNMPYGGGGGNGGGKCSDMNVM